MKTALKCIDLNIRRGGGDDEENGHSWRKP